VCDRVKLPQEFSQRPRSMADGSLDIQSQLGKRAMVFGHFKQRVVAEPPCPALGL